MKYLLIISLLLITGCNTYKDLSVTDKVEYDKFIKQYEGKEVFICNKDNFLVKRGIYILHNKLRSYSILITNDSGTPTRCGNSSIKVYETVGTGVFSGDVNINDNSQN